MTAEATTAAAADTSTTNIVVQQAANAADDAQQLQPQPAAVPPIFITNLSILSPLQKDTSSAAAVTTNTVAIDLPPLRPEEPVASLRGALTEVLGFAHLTNYRLVVENKKKDEHTDVDVVNVNSNDAAANRGGGNKSKGGKNKLDNKNNSNNNTNNCWSPHTLANAAVTISPSMKSLEAGYAATLNNLQATDENQAGENAVSKKSVAGMKEEEELVLDEYGDLSILLELLEDQLVAATTTTTTTITADTTTQAPAVDKITLNASHLAIRIHLEKYTVANIRDHVSRTRVILEGNAPYVTSLMGDLNVVNDADSDTITTDAGVDGGEKDKEKNGEDTTTVTVVADEKEVEMDKKETGDKDDNKPSSSAITKEKEEAAATAVTTKAQKETEQKAQRDAIAAALPSFSTDPDHDILNEHVTQGGDLTNFYYLVCGEEQTLMDLQKESSERNKRSASGSGNANSNNEWMVGKNGDKKENKKKGKNKKQKGNNNKSSNSKGGSDDELAMSDGNVRSNGNNNASKNQSKRSKNSTNNNKLPTSMVQVEHTLYNLNEATRVPITLKLSGYHPPPAHRRVLGDLAYIEAILPDGVTVHVTAFPLGFYVNRSNSSKFDPTPLIINNNGSSSSSADSNKDACYSHTLLDCLLQRSKPLRASWTSALSASKERSELLTSLAQSEDTFYGIFRPVASSFPNNVSGPVSANGGLGGLFGLGLLMSPAPNTFVPRLDMSVARPSWLVPLPSAKLGDMVGPKKRCTWDHDALHSYHAGRVEDELGNTFGMDVRGGGLRDWNEELQTAREMPVETFGERIDRARLVHKVLSDFGDAALHGVKAILDGYIMPMNPNESARSHVYLHNNIFFSRAVDAGLDTFKIIQGDNAAKKSASRDAHNLGVLHRLDIPGLHTLATVLVEYLGTRIVCQSVVPGILHGEKAHSLLYGAVETLSALECNEEMHKLLESSIGEGCMVATRKIPAHPLTDERMDTIKKNRITPLLGEELGGDNKKDEVVGKDTSIQVCGPMEMKGILGSDKRKYVLDCTRLTPRDANWVAKESGGTGKWEDLSSSRSQKLVPSTLEDDEWTACVLRPELVTSYAEMKISKYLKEETKAEDKKEESGKEDKKDSTSSETKDSAVSKDKTSNSDDKKKDEPSSDDSTDKEWVNVPESKNVDESKKKKEEHLAKVEDEYIRSLRYNVNVFLPFTRSIEIIDKEEHEQLKQDEEEARQLARHLWDTVIPTITKEIRSSSGNGLNLPADGRSLTELIHSRGINCRYLGRLAELARKEELEDIIAAQKAASGSGESTPTDKSKPKKRAPRFRMPVCWLELLECEMVARAAKHVLDSYMTEQGGSSTAQPAQTIASFLSAVVSVGEESAAETEVRTSKKGHDHDVLDQEDMNALTLFNAGESGDAKKHSSIKGRDEIWADIDREVGRRYRYTITLYNTSSSSKKGGESRALYTPLLRRICQRSGIRLVAKHYEVSKKCVCGGSGTSGLTASHPIAPTDILDILPLVKHAASVNGESFAPCSFNGSAGSSPSLHVLLSDAKTMYEFGHANLSSGNAAVALDYANEALAMYQRVIDALVHPQIAKCFKLAAIAHYHRDEPELALSAATKYLAVSISLFGFDSSEVLQAHLTLTDILLGSGRVPQGMKHLRCAQFLMEFMGGKHYAAISASYYRMGCMYYEAGKLEDALHLYEVAAKRRNEDRMYDCLIARNSAGVLAQLRQFKPAFDYEKKAYQLYVTFLGEEHDATKASSNTLVQLMKLALDQETQSKIQETERAKENAADAVADAIRADEEAEEAKPKKKKKQNKKKGKKA